MAEQTKREIKLHPSWLSKLDREFDEPYMAELRDFLREEKKKGKEIFPPGNEYFNALNTTPLDRVKLVIIGQDPYHGPGQAHGLCFSVRPGVPVPPSLRNMYKELAQEGLFTPVNHGCLVPWAEQGVLLLNAVLTVECHRAASHQGRGWEKFTDRVIEVVNESTENTVFFLWGSYAQKKGAIIDRERHLVLQAPHPSPLSANRGFFGCGHFTKANDYLLSKGREPINWQLPEEYYL
ncbi:MAG: uracil-DNA glycosylase [Spirochaetales bacterium]|nr:uracil-DNA glycosylase [Spirochaetales bacterium]